MSPRVVYSIGARLGGGGIGNTAHNAAVGIYQAGYLQRLFISSNAQMTIPEALIRQWGNISRGVKYLETKDATGLLAYIESTLFDAWVAAQLPEMDVFHGWNGMCLQSLRRAQRRGAITIVERASSHPVTQVRILREEYARWNVPLHLPTWNLAHSIQELRTADYTIIPSEFVRQSMLAEGVSGNKLIEIPFGVDLERFAPADSSSPHPFRVIFAGQVSLRKGVPYLIEAWKQLEWRDAELWLVGSVASDFSILRRRSDDLPGVICIPHSRELADIMRQCDVFVFPSIEEGSALVTYEAMACGLPVITTPNTGSVARDQVDGFLVPIRNTRALVDRMELLRRDSRMRLEMSRSARARASEFPWSRYSSELIRAYVGKLRRPMSGTITGTRPEVDARER